MKVQLLNPILILSFCLIGMLGINQAQAKCASHQGNALTDAIKKEIPVEIFEKLNARALHSLRLLNKKSKQEKSDKKCEKQSALIKKVYHNIIESNKLTKFTSGGQPLTLITNCSKRLPKLRDGRILIAPAGLVATAKSEDAIAAVLSHEIAHFTLSHHARLILETRGRAPATPYMWSSMRSSKIAKIKKAHEIEADLAGLGLMVNAGYNPKHALKHLKQVDKKLSLLKTPKQWNKPTRHPSAAIRREAMRKEIQSCGYTSIDQSMKNMDSSLPI